MGLYKIADLTVEIVNKYPALAAQCKRWECESGAPDIRVQVSDAQIAEARGDGRYADDYLESICAYRELCCALPAFDAMLLHASTFTIDGYAYALCAASGTGKSTHTRLLKELLGPRMDIVNGDKPIIRFTDGVPVAYGTPWCGKEGWGKNRSAPLAGIVFLERSGQNFVQELSPSAAARLIMHQIIRPQDGGMAEKTLALTDRLLESVKLWRLGCNISREAAELSYKTMTGANDED